MDRHEDLHHQQLLRLQVHRTLVVPGGVIVNAKLRQLVGVRQTGVGEADRPADQQQRPIVCLEPVAGPGERMQGDDVAEMEKLTQSLFLDAFPVHYIKDSASIFMSAEAMKKVE